MDDPGTPNQAVDYSVDGVMGPASWNANETVADFNMGNFQLKPGMTLQASGDLDGQTVTVNMSLPDLKITEANIANDIISGTSDWSSDVHACVNLPNGCTDNWVTPGGGSDHPWTANYQGTFDLVNGSNGWVEQTDANGNRAHVDWSLPNPHLDVWYLDNAVDAYDFPPNIQLNLTVTSGGQQVHSQQETTGVNSWNTLTGNAHFNLSYDIQSGDLVTVTGGGFSKDLLIQDLKVTSINAPMGHVGGTAPVGANLWIFAQDNTGGTTRYVTADDGTDVNFSIAGDLNNPAKALNPGVGGGATSRTRTAITPRLVGARLIHRTWMSGLLDGCGGCLRFPSQQAAHADCETGNDTLLETCTRRATRTKEGSTTGHAHFDCGLILLFELQPGRLSS